MKRICILLTLLVFLLVGCRKAPDETVAPLPDTGPDVTVTAPSGSSDLSDWIVEGDAPESDFQIPAQPTGTIITQ